MANRRGIEERPLTRWYSHSSATYDAASLWKYRHTPKPLLSAAAERAEQGVEDGAGGRFAAIGCGSVSCLPSTPLKSPRPTVITIWSRPLVLRSLRGLTTTGASTREDQKRKRKRKRNKRGQNYERLARLLLKDPRSIVCALQDVSTLVHVPILGFNGGPGVTGGRVQCLLSVGLTPAPPPNPSTAVPARLESGLHRFSMG